MNKLVISAAFKLIFLSVLALTILCFVGFVVIMIMNAGRPTIAEIPQIQMRVFEICTFGWQSGFGGILGLIGGKMVK